MSYKSLELLQQEAQAANTALAAGLKRKMEEDKKAVQTSLEAAQSAFNSLNEETQGAVRDDSAIKLLLAAFEKPKRRSGGGTGKRGNRFNEAAILALLGTNGKLQSEVQAHFKVSKASIITWGKRLAGKIEISEDKTNKTQNIWRKV